MITKRFNYIFRQFKWYSSQNEFSKQKTLYNPSQQPHPKHKPQTAHYEQIINLTLTDIKLNKYSNYQKVKSFFEKELIDNTDAFFISTVDGQQNKKERQLKVALIQAVSKYPMLEISQQSINAFYKQVVGRNVHLKDNQFLEKSLILAMLVDSKVVNSPLYVEFARYYVKHNIQIIRALLSVNLSQQNVISTIKLFLLRIFQRGFLPRQPSYTRTLYINNPIPILNLMIQNQQLTSTLMIKKVFYQYFIQIKRFYETQMKENLYHNKNVYLFEEKLVPALKILSKSYESNIERIENQCKYLRQLYIKLFLVKERTTLKNSIYLYDVVKNKRQLNQAQQKLKESQTSQEKQILFQFLNKVQSQFQLILQDQDQSAAKENIRHFDAEELMLILLNKSELKLKNSGVKLIEEQLAQRISPIWLKKFFNSTLKLLDKISHQELNLNTLSLKNVFQNEQIYQQLQLSQLSQFSQQQISLKNNKIKEALINTILKKDIKNIGNSQLLNLIRIYLNCQVHHCQTSSPNNTQQPLLSTHQQNRSTLISFILRFISDHHSSLPFDNQFQQILILICFGSTNLQSKTYYKPHFHHYNQNLVNKNFNDQQNNYPLPILQELKQHNKKHLWKIKSKQLKDRINEHYA